jgi:hypothetical protein
MSISPQGKFISQMEIYQSNGTFISQIFISQIFISQIFMSQTFISQMGHLSAKYL